MDEFKAHLKEIIETYMDVVSIDENKDGSFEVCFDEDGRQVNYTIAVSGGA